MYGNNFTKKDPLVDAVSKVMQENQLRRDIEKQFQEEIGIQAKRELPFQQHADYDRVLAERTAVALNEELKGNQTKIDANKNGKVDGQDFKILKAKKGLAEAEYPPGAGADTAKDKDPDMVKGRPGEEQAEKKIPTPPKRPTNMEEEALDELSKGTLGSYVKKASHDVATKSAATGRYAERANKVKDETKKGDYSNYQQGKKDDATADKMFGKSWKRREGIAKAVDKLTKEGAELDEAKYSAKAARAGEDLGKPGKNFEKIAAKAGKEYGSEERGKKVAGAILAKMRAKHMEEGKKNKENRNPMLDTPENVKKRNPMLDTPENVKKRNPLVYGVKKEETVSESAPPGGKYERMVKHIKKKYSKDGLTDKEKSIAYATAWKAKGKDAE